MSKGQQTFSYGRKKDGPCTEQNAFLVYRQELFALLSFIYDLGVLE